MAEYITAKEMDKKIAEMQKARDKMTRPEHRICPLCLSLTSVDQREERNGTMQCWCDFPGTPMFDSE